MNLPTKKQIDDWNEQIRITRSMLYRQNSDELFIAYQKYLALGKTEEAEQARQEWLTVIKDIDEKNPYYYLETETETITTDTETETPKVSTEDVVEEAVEDTTADTDEETTEA